MRTQIQNQQFDEERALYHLQHTDVIGCQFAGPADGESALKEARDVTVRDCGFSLRYPLWHVDGFRLQNSRMDEKTRAALWYSRNGEITSCTLGGIKCLRECHDITISQCCIQSPEFGWKCSGIQISHSTIEAEYLLLECRDLKADGLRMFGKYSFQYTENVHIVNSVLNTKDAFWHSKNVVVEDSEVRGEYLGWFSDGLTLINCKIIGTQPLCYCKNLRLINCTMEGTDLSFEYSDVTADIVGDILSVKNPKSGTITADSVGEIVREDPVIECTGKVILRKAKP